MDLVVNTIEINLAH